MDGDDWLASDWAAANHRMGLGEPLVPDLSAVPGSRPPADLSARSDLSAETYLSVRAPRTSTPAHIWFTRTWALVKMGTLAASTWWTMSSVHAHLGDIICAYGAVALFSGVGARWRKRYFGPGQQLEPELYEALGSLLYRVGTVLVLAGGLLAALAPGLRA